MNVVASTADFRRAVNIATRVTERRNIIPVLGGVRCHANGSLEVVGTDLDTMLAVKVPRQPGPNVTFALLSPREVAHAVHTAGSDSVSLAPGKDAVDIVSGALSVTAGMLPADDFPMHLDRPLAEGFSATLSGAHFAEIARVAGAMSTEETRYYLNGLHLASIGDTMIRATATNGHQLYFVDLVTPDAVGKLPTEGIIIPRKVVGLLIALAREAVDGVRFAVGTPPAANDVTTTAPEKAGKPIVDASLNIRGAEVRMVAKTIDGNFPDCQRVVPSPSGHQAIIPMAELKRALRAISGHSRNDRAIRLDFTRPDSVTVSAAYVSLNLSASVTIPCQQAMHGMTIGFNGGYLSSIIGAAGGDELVLDIDTPASPALIRNPADTAWTGVLMTMRVS